MSTDTSKGLSHADYCRMLGSEDLRVFMDTLKQFNDAFSRLMVSETDFTLRLEVRGDGGRLLHCKCSSESFNRPIGTKKAGRSGT